MTEIISTDKFHTLHPGLGNVVKVGLDAKFRPGVMVTDILKRVQRVRLTADERSQMVSGEIRKGLQIKSPACLSQDGDEYLVSFIEWVDTNAVDERGNTKLAYYRLAFRGKLDKGDPAFARFHHRADEEETKAGRKDGELVEETEPFEFPDNPTFINLGYFSHRQREFIPLYVKLYGKYYCISSEVRGVVVTKEVTAEEVPPHLVPVKA